MSCASASLATASQNLVVFSQDDFTTLMEKIGQRTQKQINDAAQKVAYVLRKQNEKLENVNLSLQRQIDSLDNENGVLKNDVSSLKESHKNVETELQGFRQDRAMRIHFEKEAEEKKAHQKAVAEFAASSVGMVLGIGTSIAGFIVAPIFPPIGIPLAIAGLTGTGGALSAMEITGKRLVNVELGRDPNYRSREEIRAEENEDSHWHPERWKDPMSLANWNDSDDDSDDEYVSSTAY